jgi:hypothetical protein
MSDPTESPKQARLLVVCVTWGLQTTLCIKTFCTECSRTIAIEPRTLVMKSGNRKVTPICANCVRQALDKSKRPFAFGGIVINGQVYTDHNQARQAWEFNRSKN